MTTRGVDDFLDRLHAALARHGIHDSRIAAEAQDHLIDAVEAGQRRGLSLEDAEREAMQRFGDPEQVARFAAAGSNHMSWAATVLDTLWQRRWWVAAPTLLAAITTSLASYHFLPTLYRSETTVRVVPQRRPESPETDTKAVRRIEARLRDISRRILSPTSLERVAMDFGLYDSTESARPRGDTVGRMRRSISIDLLTFDPGGVDEDAFRVGFVAREPQLALRITERLASLFIQQNLQARQGEADLRMEAAERQIADVRGRLVAQEEALAKSRARTGEPTQTDVLPYQVLLERYKTLLVQAEELRADIDFERRSIGEQYRIVDRPHVPMTPVGPSRASVNLAGTAAGFGMGLLLAVLRARTERARGQEG
jgi:uncharacterized protein involved in exopolysaccharide biosynthesis